VVLLLTSFGFWEAHAQEATSFEQLKLLVKPGDTVTVKESSGQITKGKVAELTGSSLRLVAGGGVRDMADRDVLEIRQRRGDSLGNGAMIGAIAGGAFGTFSAFLSDCGSDPCAAERMAVIGVTTGLGVGIGVGIDALITRTKLVYRGSVRQVRFSIAPVMDKQRRGLALSVRF
jgi:hypothetical protein